MGQLKRFSLRRDSEPFDQLRANGKDELANGKDELANGKDELANGGDELGTEMQNSLRFLPFGLSWSKPLS